MHGKNLRTTSALSISAGDLPPDEDAPESDEPVGPDGDAREWTVTADQHGERLDRVLVQHLSGLSRHFLQQVIDEGGVLIDDRPCSKPSLRLKVGQRVHLVLRAPAQAHAFSPEPIPLEVVHEDVDILVIHKPAGLVVHPAAGHWSGTLLNALLHHDPGSAALPRAGIVHRLDKDTSGLMVVARTRTAMDALVGQMARREVSREYLAITDRVWSGPTSLPISRAIGRDPRQRLRMAVLADGSPGAREARTDVTVLDRSASATLVHCRLHTGRTHQIRVHLASVGQPLAGDGLYGGSSRLLPRQALHAWRLSLSHPVTQAALSWRAEPPADFDLARDRAGLRYNLPT